MYYKIKEISDISGVSVRMLHYYDKIGLLKPEKVSQAGYRLYTDDNIKKLSQILFYKELGFSLEEIKDIMSSAPSARQEVLRLQLQLLSRKRDKIDALIRAIEKSVASLERGEDINSAHIFTSFDLAEISRNKEQLKKDLMTHLLVSDEDCGSITSEYSSEDWTIVMSGMEKILRKIARNADKGPSAPEIQQLVGEFKEYINDNLMKCDVGTLRTLGTLYVDNPLYRSHMEQYGEDFPEFLKKAIELYAAKA
jgi:DNA-binding transcriptional MerR regulator